MTDLSALLDAIDGAHRFDEWRETAVPAAVAVERAVSAGQPLGPVAERVAETCRQRSHVPLLAPLASALLLDALRRGDYVALDDLAGRSLYAHGLTRAVLRAAPAGLPPARLVMARHWHDADKARTLARNLVAQQPEQLVGLVEGFATDSILADEIPTLLRSLGAFGSLELGPVLSHLAPHLALDARGLAALEPPRG